MLLKRPITATMLVLATFIFGYIALQELSVDLLPDVDVPSLMVRAEWPGASASEIETRINEELVAVLGVQLDLCLPGENASGIDHNLHDTWGLVFAGPLWRR